MDLTRNALSPEAADRTANS